VKRIAFALTAMIFTMSVRAADADLVIYGGTSAGVAAAIQASRMGKTVVVIEPGTHVGGLTTGGLGWTDSGNKEVVGGIAREFYRRVKTHYDNPAAWVHEPRDGYKFYRKDEDAMWTFEPKVAEAILLAMLAEAKVPVKFGERLDRKNGVVKTGKRITSIKAESGQVYAGKQFMDATYEGDLMAAAGVSFTVGREANAQYGETFNGLARKWNRHTHRFVKNVDPFVKPGDKSSGLLPGIEPGPLPADGEADNRVQAYCYRLCMSRIPANRVPFPKPEGYDVKAYELLFRNFEAGDLRVPMKPDAMPNGKTDTNNNYAVSTDYIGASYRYPEATYAERDAILKDHERYQKGLMWSLANHPRVPQKVRDEMAKWGLAKDEFTGTGNWPHQIYVREARRMVSDAVLTEKDCRRIRETPRSVGMGSYNMDSHNVLRYVTPEGFVQNEGDVQESPGGPYRVDYLSLVPKKGECENLTVPVCLSASHIAYGSVRMEPVFMVLGQSAATAAVLAIDGGLTVQDVPYESLKARLLADKQVLTFAAAPKLGAIDPKSLPGVVVDDDAAACVGFGSASSALSPYVGTGYRHDNAQDRGKQSARFTPDLPAAGRYEVRVAYTASPNRARNVPVEIHDAGGTKTVTLDQRKAPPIDKLWASLGTFAFEKGRGGSVMIKNDGADGHVVIDAVQWIPAKP
jgi:hypothetical protein